MHRPVTLALVVVGAVASTAHAHPPAARSGDTGDGVGALTLVLLALAVATARSLIGAFSRPGAVARRLGAMAAAGVVAAALTIAAPHVVHHTFDADQGAACPVLQIVGGTDATSGETAPVAVSVVADAAEPFPATAAIAGVPLAFAPVRAPPA